MSEQGRDIGRWYGDGGYAVRTCICEHPHIGARLVGMVDRCETCGFITVEQLEAIVSAAQRQVTYSRDELVKALRMGVVTWNTVGPRKGDLDVSTFLADWLIENGVL